MLVDEHSDGDSAHVETVQKVLDVLVCYWILRKSLFVLDDALSHGRHHVVVSVPDRYQGVNKPAGEENTKTQFNKQLL